MLTSKLSSISVFPSRAIFLRASTSDVRGVASLMLINQDGKVCFENQTPEISIKGTVKRLAKNQVNKMRAELNKIETAITQIKSARQMMQAKTQINQIQLLSRKFQLQREIKYLKN